jgi:hypothetical protein
LRYTFTKCIDLTSVPRKSLLQLIQNCYSMNIALSALFRSVVSHLQVTPQARVC